MRTVMLARLTSGADQACCVRILTKWGRLLRSVGASVVWDSLQTGHTSGACMSLRYPVPLPLGPLYSPVSRLCDLLCVRPPSAPGYIILGFLVDVGEKGVEVESEAIVNHDKNHVYQLLTTRQ